MASMESPDMSSAKARAKWTDVELAHNEFAKPAPEAPTGTVKLVSGDDDIILVPTPSADPRDPLNLPKWRKVMFVITASLYSAVAGSIVSGFGSLLAFFRPIYLSQGISASDIGHLVAYPPLFQGISNLLFIPLANSIGRRPTFLFTCLLTIAGALTCANAKTFNVHLGGRMLVGLGAGLGEALPPLMISEVHFLHERSTALTWQVGVQAVGSTALVLLASPIAGAVGASNWYYVCVGLMVVVFLLGIFFLPESKYIRSPTTRYATGHDLTDPVGKAGAEVAAPVKLHERRPLDYEHYAPRTFLSGLRLFVNPPEWVHLYRTPLQLVKLFFVPPVLWGFVLNGAALGANISISATQATVLLAPPYSWSPNSISYVNTGQIVVAAVAVPLLGYGSDRLINWKARRNGGVHEPESRLIPLVIPLFVGILSLLLYGFAAQHPDRIHWGALVFAVPADFFSFVGCNIAAITYLLDAFEKDSGPILILITAVRGFVGFGLSYVVVDFVEKAGYVGCFGTYAGVQAALGLLGVVVYFTGKRMRRRFQNFVGQY